MTENTITDGQIAAGAAVLDDDGKPVGRNTAIMVWDAMIGAATSGDAPASRYVLAEHEIGGIIGYWNQTSNSRYELCRAVETAVLARIGRAAAPATASGHELPVERINEIGLGLRIQAFENAAYRAACGQAMTEPEKAEHTGLVAFARAAVSAATKPTREKQLEAVAHAAAMDMVRIHEALGLPADGEVDAEKIIAHIAATKPTADLSKLIRFAMLEFPTGGGYLKPRDNGAWVKFEDVQSLLATKPAAHSVDLGGRALNDAGWALVEALPHDSLTANGFNNLKPALRVAIEKYLSLVATKPAAAPQKDTPESMANSNARFAINGAIQYGRENRNQPPSTDHWLYEYWNIGRQLNEAGRTGWDNVTPMPATPAASTTGAAQTAEQVRERQREECWSRDEEDFNHLSLSDLIDSHEDLKPGDTVWVGEAVHPEAAQMVNVDSILENIGEAAYDIGGEHAEDYPDVTAEQTKELEQLVVDWLNRSCNTSFWTVTNIKPYVLSADDFPTPTHSLEAGDA